MTDNVKLDPQTDQVDLDQTDLVQPEIDQDAKDAAAARLNAEPRAAMRSSSRMASARSGLLSRVSSLRPATRSKRSPAPGGANREEMGKLLSPPVRVQSSNEKDSSAAASQHAAI